MGHPIEPSPERDRLYANRDITPIFSDASFSCFLNRSSIRFLQDGQLSVSFIVPAESVDEALPLRFLTANPLPLTVTVQVDSSYLADLAESELKLRAL